MSEFNRPATDESAIKALLGDLSASVQHLSGLSQLAALAFDKTEPTTAHEEAGKYIAGELLSLSSDLRGRLGRLREALGRKELTAGPGTYDSQGSEAVGAEPDSTGSSGSGN